MASLPVWWWSSLGSIAVTMRSNRANMAQLAMVLSCSGPRNNALTTIGTPFARANHDVFSILSMQSESRAPITLCKTLADQKT